MMRVNYLRSGCATERTHRDKVGVANGANVGEPESNEGGGATGRGDKLDLETVRWVDRDHSAQVPGFEPVLGHVMQQNHRFER
jgi:hypothetical protein